MKQILLLGFLCFTLFSCTETNTQDKTDQQGAESYVKKAPNWSKNANIYELNIRQYSEEGTFKAIEKDLDRIKDLGVDIIWFMPIHPIGVTNRKGTDGSYYSVKDYKEVHPDYGTMQDFKELVNAIHDKGMYVIIDWVANHTAFDNVWIEAGHKDWYTLDSVGELQPPLGTDWWDVADLNYDNAEMRSAMIDALQFWIRDCDIDGYRCDVADWVPTDFWNDARYALDTIKPVFMLAEAETPELHEKAFDMTYGWHFHFVMNEIAEGKKNVNDIRAYLNDTNKVFKRDDYRLHFTSNHDENSWKGTVKERLGDAIKTFAVLSATMEGTPLIYNGQEASLDKRLEFFEKDAIKWNDFSMTPFYQQLLDLNHNNQALWNGEHGGEIQVLSPESDSLGFAFYRVMNDDEVLCVFNFSVQERSVQFDNPSNGSLKELFSESKLETDKVEITLPAWGYAVYHNE